MTKKESPLTFEEVNKVIDEKIRPYVKEHGGDIELLSVSDKCITVSFLGACRFCPSAQTTIEDVVQELICNYFDDKSISVVLKTEVHEDLINFAKTLLKKDK